MILLLILPYKRQLRCSLHTSWPESCSLHAQTPDSRLPRVLQLLWREVCQKPNPSALACVVAATHAHTLSHTHITGSSTSRHCPLWVLPCEVGVEMVTEMYGAAGEWGRSLENTYMPLLPLFNSTFISLENTDLWKLSDTQDALEPISLPPLPGRWK